MVTLSLQQELIGAHTWRANSTMITSSRTQQLAQEILVTLSGQQADSPFPSDVAGIREMLPARTNVGLYSGPFYQRTLA